MSNSSKAVKDRVKASRDRRKQAGLVRVEVQVPADRAHSLRAYAAELRADAESELRLKVRKHLESAYGRFRVLCLDNISIDPATATLGDAEVVAAALMHRGNTESFKLGREIRDLLR